MGNDYVTKKELKSELSSAFEKNNKQIFDFIESNNKVLLEAIAEQFVAVDQRFDNVEDRLDIVEAKLVLMDQRLQNVEQDVVDLKGGYNRLMNTLDIFLKRLDDQESDLIVLKAENVKMKQILKDKLGIEVVL